MLLVPLEVVGVRTWWRICCHGCSAGVLPKGDVRTWKLTNPCVSEGLLKFKIHDAIQQLWLGREAAGVRLE